MMIKIIIFSILSISSAFAQRNIVIDSVLKNDKILQKHFGDKDYGIDKIFLREDTLFLQSINENDSTYGKSNKVFFVQIISITKDYIYTRSPSYHNIFQYQKIYHSSILFKNKNTQEGDWIYVVGSFYFKNKYTMIYPNYGHIYSMLNNPISFGYNVINK